jgi:hypothetical protein
MQQQHQQSDEDIMMSSNKIFDKNVINNESILLNELAQNSPNHLFNIHKYKLYVEQTEQTLNQIYRQISKLTDLMREYKKMFQCKIYAFFLVLNDALRLDIRQIVSQIKINYFRG